MGQFDLRFRQIHLDFHTSEFIDGIGSQFDPEEFAATLEKARVNSITCFARWSTRRWPAKPRIAKTCRSS